MLQDPIAIFRTGLEIAEDVLHHDDGRIDDDSEIHRAERQQVGVLALQHQNDDGEEQREGNIRADDQGAAQIPQEYPLDHEHQNAAEHQIVQHRVGGDAHQRTAVVVGNDLHAWGQGAVAVELCDFLLDLRNDVVGVLGAPHHDDRRGDVVLLLSPRDAEPRHKADRDRGDVLDLDRQPARLGENDILDILDFVAFGDVVGAAGVDQADAADVDRLLADRDLASADINVGVAERRHELRHGDVVSLELLQVGIDIELLGGAAPGVDLHHAGNGHETAGDHVVLQRPQIGQAEIGRADQLIAVDLADQTGLLDGRNEIAGQGNVLLDVVGGLGQREIVVHAVPEGHADKGQAVKRRRTDVDNARSRIEPDLHRDRVIFLHLFGGKTRGLRGDLQDHRRRIRIGLDVQPGERGKAGGAEYDQAQHDDRAAGQTEVNDALDQGCTLTFELRPSPVSETRSAFGQSQARDAFAPERAL